MVMSMSTFRNMSFTASEGGARRLQGVPAAVVTVLCLTLSCYILAINSFWMLDLMRRSGLFASLLLALVFLLYPATPWSARDRPTALDWLLAALGAAGGLYIWFTYLTFVGRQLQMSSLDMFFAITTTLLALEAGRRSLGIWLTALAALFIAYALLGHLIPGPLGHFGVRPERLMLRLYMVDEGMFGSVLQVAQTFIGLFVLFGAFLVVIGASDALTRIGLAVSGQYAGGPAKVATIASGLTGMVSGTASANVATTGTLTIPMMKRVGFAPYFAGAVEAIASTGGLIMPPVMGAAAFLIAEFVGIPYGMVALGALIPALLYYGSLLLLIHIRARKVGIGGLPASQIPRLKDVLIERGHLLIPIVILIAVLISGRTPTYAAIISIVSALVLSLVRADTRITPRKFIQALISGAAAIVPVSIACLIAGIIVGIVTMTGVAQVFTHYIEDFSGGYLLAALALTAIASIFLSCALPATAVYIVVAVTIAPALVKMGATPLAAHFFVFWFGVLSNITPPVAIACFTAAGIADASPTKVAFAALRMAVPAMTIPFAIVIHPALLLESIEPFALVQAVVIITVGIACYIWALENWLDGPLRAPIRALFGAAAILCLITPDVTTGWIGVAFFLLGIGLWRSGRLPAAVSTQL